MKKSVGIILSFFLITLLTTSFVAAAIGREGSLKSAGEQMFAAENPFEIAAAAGNQIVEDYVTESEQEVYFSNYGQLRIPAGLRVIRFLNGEVEIQSPEKNAFQISYGLWGKFNVEAGKALYVQGEIFDLTKVSTYAGFRKTMARLRSTTINRRLHVKTPSAVAGARG